MATAPTPAAPVVVADPTPMPGRPAAPAPAVTGVSPEAKQPVIRRAQETGETANQRLLRKYVPAWVISGAVHVALAVTLVVAAQLIGSPPREAVSLAELTVVPQAEEKDSKDNLVETEVGLDPELPTAIEADKLDTVNVQDATQATDAPGIADAKTMDRKDYIPLPGVGTSSDAGVTGDAGRFLSGSGSLGEGTVASDGFLGRGAATRSKLAMVGGGNTASEAAVARGLSWLAKQQKQNGMWAYEGAKRSNTVAATGMALLPFLAAGQTHKSTAKDNKYKANVDAGIRYLIANQQANGSFKGPGGTNMYAHAIATIAFCELLGMSGDKSLAPHAQRAVNYIVAGQGSNGSWGYTAGGNGDTSIVGWQIQALQSAKLCKDLTVDKRSFEKARKFLDSVASGSNKSEYGYASPGASMTLTPVGLLCRYYADGWGPNHPGMAAGVGYLMKKQQPDKGYMNIYYYYYATQVMHFYEGKEWYETWNPAMRDLLIGVQVPEGKANGGSWDPDGHQIGTECGRLGMTCMTLLTLEVYYRHLPLYKRDTGGLKELERAK